jgi:hypothetical protein
MQANQWLNSQSSFGELIKLNVGNKREEMEKIPHMSAIVGAKASCLEETSCEKSLKDCFTS